MTPPAGSLAVLHREGEPRQRGHVRGRVPLARARLQPPHHLRHVAVPRLQWQPVPQRRADADARQLHAGRLHHLRAGHGGSNHLVWQERRGARPLLTRNCFHWFLGTHSRFLSSQQEPKLAFEDVDATELYPCVMFYSSNPGEKVSVIPTLCYFCKRFHFF